MTVTPQLADGESWTLGQAFCDAYRSEYSLQVTKPAHEGETVTGTITRFGDLGLATTPFAIKEQQPAEDGRAWQEDGDFSIGAGASGQFLPGETQKVFDIVTVADGAPEWTEKFTLRAYDPSPEEYVESDDAIDDGFIIDGDLSFDLAPDVLVANYDDDNGNGVTDYDEYATDSGPDDDLYQVTLHAPGSTAKPGTTATFYASPDFFNVYRDSSKDQAPLTPDELTWSAGQDIPQTLWLEVKRGSSTMNDAYVGFTSSDNGDNQAGGKSKTAVNFQITTVTDPNGDSTGDVKNKSRKWLVGQMVDQYVYIQCPPELRQNPTYQWTVPGNVLRDYIQTSGSASTIPLTDDSGGGPEGASTGLKRSEVRFFWVSSTEGSADLYSVSIVVGNISGRSFTVTSKYNVFSPTVVANRNLGIATMWPDQSRIGLAPVGNMTGGIEFIGSAAMPTGFAAGQWNFLQTWKPLRHTTDATTGQGFHVRNNGLWGLDTFLPYEAPAEDPYAGAGWSTGPDAHMTRDTPFMGLAKSNSQTSMADEFFTYQMFRPPGSESCWVPLRVVHWSFSVAALQGQNGWAVSGTPAQFAIAFNPATDEPTWDRLNVDTGNDYEPD
jgi:hypothetical protein